MPEPRGSAQPVRMNSTASGPPPLILASASPRRADILHRLGIQVEVHPTRVPEVHAPEETPSDYVLRLAADKAEAGGRPGRWTLAGDTVVVLDDRILEKPADAEAAVAMLMALSGRDHEVYTGLALRTPAGDTHARLARATVECRRFDEAFARAYVATGESLDKAGAYGIQGKGAALVTSVRGDFFTVMGLSVAALMDLFDEAGYPFTFGRPVPASAQ